MGWVGSWVHKFTWQWVGLGQLFGGLGWAGSMKIDPRTTLICTVLQTQLNLLVLVEVIMVVVVVAEVVVVVVAVVAAFIAGKGNSDAN